MPPNLASPTWDNKYNAMFRIHLTEALNAAGVEYHSVLTNVYPNTNTPVSVRDWQWRIVLSGGGAFGNVRQVNIQRMHPLLMRVLKSLAPRLTRWQRFRFWLYVWWAQLRGEFWYG